MMAESDLLDLKAWLRDDRQRHVPSLLAVRAALRVLPALLELNQRKRQARGKMQRQTLMHAFRATFVVWVMQTYGLNSRAPANAAAAAAAKARSNNFDIRGYQYLAFNSARFSASSASAQVSSAAANAAFEAISAAIRSADEFAGAGKIVLESVNADIRWLRGRRYSQTLINQPLWLEDVRDDRRFNLNCPSWSRSQIDLFRASLSSSLGSWLFFVDWYELVLSSNDNIKNPELLERFMAEEIAMLPRGFWNRDPDAVMSDIAGVAGRKYSKGQTEELDQQKTMKEFAVELLDRAGRALSTTEIYDAFEDAGFDVEPPSIRGRLNSLTDEGKIIRVSRGTYAALPSPEVREVIEPPEPPSVPSARPAAIEPFWREGKLVLPALPSSSQTDDSSLLAALTALRDELVELSADASVTPNIDHRPVDYMRQLVEKIPDGVPSQALLFRLGHARDVLDSFSKITDEEWPDFLAARYRKMLLLYDRTVRQFTKWREFVRNAADQQLDAEQIAEVPNIVDAVATELKSEDAAEFVEPNVPEALKATGAPIIEWEEALLAGNEMLAEDLLESVNNVLKRIAEYALAVKGAGIDPVKEWGASTAKGAAAAFGKEARKSIVKAFGDLGKSTGPALIRVLKRLLKISIGGGATVAGGALLLPRMFYLYPDIFGWLQPVLHFLRLI